jgi:hypothetical protein
MPDNERIPDARQHLRAAIEVVFIIFLFYSNLLMGEFTRSNGLRKTLAFALRDIFTRTNFTIAVIAAVFGHFAFEMLRRLASPSATPPDGQSS